MAVVSEVFVTLLSSDLVVRSKRTFRNPSLVTPYVKPAATAEILANCCSSLIFDRGPEGNGRPTGKNVRSEAAASWESDRDASTPRAPHRGEVTGGQPGGPLRAGRDTVKGPRRGTGPRLRRSLVGEWRSLARLPWQRCSCRCTVPPASSSCLSLRVRG